MNHAYVVPKVMPTVEQIDAVAREFVAERFPQFELTLSDDDGPTWFVHLRENESVRLIFWMGKYLEENASHPCIEFRHGHSYDFLWWIEREITKKLHDVFGGVTVDDGIGQYEIEPVEHRYYYNYLEWMYKERFQDRPGVFERLTRMYISESCNFFPELKELFQGGEQKIIDD